MDVSECVTAMLVASDTLPIYIFIVVADLTVVSCNLIVGYMIMTCKLYHIHLRICFANIILAMSMRNIFTIWRAARRIHVSATAQSPCDYMDDLGICMALSKLAQSPVLMWFMAYAVITSERIVSVIYTNTYERREYPFVVLLVNALPWTKFGIDFANHAQFLFSSGPVVSHVPYCASTQNGTQVFTISSLFNWTVPISVAIIISLIGLKYAVWKKGKLCLSSVPRLSSRFELRNSATALKIIFPNAIICLLALLISQTVSVYLMLMDQSDLRSYAILKEILSAVFYPIVFILFPIITLYCSPAAKHRMCFRTAKVGGVHARERTTIFSDASSAAKMTLDFWEKNALVRRK